MPHRDIEQINQAEAEALSSIASARSEAEQMITRARERSVRLLQERKQAADVESLVIRTDGNSIKINRFLYGRRN